MLTVVKRSFANVDELTLLLLFKTIIRPVLEYGNTIWVPFGKDDQKRLERVQRRVTGMVTRVKHLSYPERLRPSTGTSMAIIPETQRRHGDQLLHGWLTVSPEIFLTWNDSARTRGHEWKLVKLRATKPVRRNVFSVLIINDWKSLLNTVVIAQSINQFKARLD